MKNWLYIFMVIRVAMNVANMINGRPVSELDHFTVVFLFGVIAIINVIEKKG